MRQTFMYFAMAAALLSGCKQESPPGAVKLVVEFQGFRPECIRVTAWDADAPERRESRPLRPEAVTGPLQSVDKRGEVTVAVFRAPSWGHTLQMSAEGFERGACDAEGFPLAGREPVAVIESGRVMTRDGEASAPVTLTLTASDVDGDGYVASNGGAGGTDCDDASAAAYPGATEVCDDIDNNCDGGVNEGYQVGQSCAEDYACGTWACGEDGARLCNGPPPTVFYLDEDGDGFGGSRSVSACQKPETGNYVTVGGDCNDTDADIKPGAAEVCDGLDNDCNGNVDDVPGLGDSCEQEGVCNGTWACDVNNRVLVCEGDDALKFYRDLDEDGYGLDTDIKYSCTGASPDPRYIAVAGDCNDGDRFTHKDAVEICDGRDNNCDGVDDGPGVCPADPSFAPVSTGVTGNFHWRTVVTYDGAGVWMAGENGNWARRPAGQADFTMGTCDNGSSIWYALWVDERASPESEERFAYVGGNGRRLARIAKEGTNCDHTPRVAADFDTRGFIAFTSESGHLLGVGNEVGGMGKTFDWNGGDAPVPLSSDSYARLKDVHGLRESLLFAVGDAEGGKPSIYRYNTVSEEWDRDNAVPDIDRDLLGVYVVNDKLAYAVGVSQTVLKWDGTRWTDIPMTQGTPPTGTIRSVLAFGESLVYVVTGSGVVARYDGSKWEELLSVGSTVTLFDIAGTRPDDIWVVGAGNRVFHWPKP